MGTYNTYYCNFEPCIWIFWCSFASLLFHGGIKIERLNFQICKTALFPALIFYIYLAYTIQIRAERKNFSNHQKISFQMIELAGGNLLLMLGLIALTCILFGMGMPTVGTYMVVSVLSAPALVKLGIPLLAAHMFVFYYGLMAMVTPPVGVGVIVATGITEGNYFKTAFHATKLALPGFILPLFFIFRPEILWIDVSMFEAFLTFVYVLAGLMCLASIFERYLLNKLNLYGIIVLVILCYLLLSPGSITSIVGLLLFFIFFIYQYIKRKNSQKIKTE